MRNYRGLILLLVIIVISAGALASESPQIHARVYFESPDQCLRLQALGLDIIYGQNEYFEIIGDRAELDRIVAAGFKTEIIHDDFGAFLRSRLTPDKDMGGYMTLDEVMAALDAIVMDHPSITTDKVNIGTTIEGRPMYAVKISDNPDVDEDEPEILITSAIHAREVITPLTVLNIMNHLTDNYGVDPRITDIVDNREIWFVPMVNPDGYFHNQVIAPYGGGMWRKNRRDNGDESFGVDLNRNFGYEWGHDDIGSSPYTGEETYRGTAPFSEPESQAMRDFTLAHDFVIADYFHSYSNLFLWAWGYTFDECADQRLFQALGDSMSTFNGYDPHRGSLFYLTNGATDDWYYGEQTLKNKTYGFTTEIGSINDYFWPPVERIPQLVAENLEPALFLCEIADNVHSILPPDPPMLVLEDTVSTVGYQIDWSPTDEHNPPGCYELIEAYNNLGVHTNPADDMFNFDYQGFSLATARYHSEPFSFYSGDHDTIPHHMTISYTYNVQPDDTLRFWTYFDLDEQYDFAYVFVTTDLYDYTPIEGNITTHTNMYGYNMGNGITGSSGGWVEAEFDLSDYEGQDIYLAYVFFPQPGDYSEGIYIDDIYPAVGFETETVISSSLVDTFYVFTDKPDGYHYYRARQMDLQDQWSFFSALDSVLVRAPFICGDLNDDEAVNLLDIVYLINHKYKDGPAPDPVDSGDVNSDGVVNILDIVYMINFKYKDGPDPDCP